MKHRTDTNNEPTKEVRQWNGIPLNITTKTGESRFSFSPPMTCDYGCIRGTWGAGLDGKALDVYVISDAPTVFKVVQITPAGAIDEHKYILGSQSFDHAVETFLKHVPKQLFGAASQYSIAQLQDDIMQQSKVKKDADELAEFVEQLESLIESDEAYDSNVYVLSFEVADDGDITGKFEDAWNGRVFAYSVEKDRIGYKPALKLDRMDSATAAKRFDIFSSGYKSLQLRQDATVKSGKKPRCTAISYGCGRACIQLKNTCWINSSGQRAKKPGGAVASISQGRIDKLRTLARYLAANGNNKWSKYGSAESLAAKAGNLEAKRANLFERNATNQALNKLPAINPIQEKAPKVEKFKEPDSLPPQIAPVLIAKPKATAAASAAVKPTAAGKEIYDLKFTRKYGSNPGEAIQLAKDVIGYMKNPSSFENLSPRNKAEFLDEVATTNNVPFTVRYEELIEKANALSDSFKKMDIQNALKAGIIRSKGSKDLWDTLANDEKQKVVSELIKIKSPLTNEMESLNYTNQYAIELVSEMRKVRREFD